METAEVLLGLGSAMALSLALGLLLARLLWGGLLRAMCACMGLARRAPAPAVRPASPAIGSRSFLSQHLGRASARG